LHSSNPADGTRLSLDGYRIQVFERLKSCADTRKLRDILAEVDVTLNATGLSTGAQRTFWEGLYTDLDVVAEESTYFLARHAAVTLSAIIAAARIDIAQYLALVSS
jgi:hypothetical protein